MCIIRDYFITHFIQELNGVVSDNICVINCLGLLAVSFY
jgi:hypothetical protein